MCWQQYDCRYLSTAIGVAILIAMAFIFLKQTLYKKMR